MTHNNQQPGSDDLPELARLVMADAPRDVLRAAARQTIRNAIAASRRAASSCVACEGKPSGDNNPCAVCGRSSLPDVAMPEHDAKTAFKAAFLSWNGFHTDAELEAEWARGTLVGEMFRAGLAAQPAEGSARGAPWPERTYVSATPAAIERAAPADVMGQDIDAAEKQAALYDDDDRECIKTDVINSFYAGIAYERKRIAAEGATQAGKVQPKLMRQAVANVVRESNGDLGVVWMRPERVQVGTLLYCAIEPAGDKQGAQGGDK